MWGPKQQQAFQQVKLEMAQEIALGPIQAGDKCKISYISRQEIL